MTETEWADEPQEDGYYVNENDGATKSELPRLAQQLDETVKSLHHLCVEWDGTDIEAKVWAGAQAVAESRKAVLAEMERLGVTLKSAGLG